MTETIDLWGLTSEVELWQAIILTVVSFAVGLLGGFVGLALGTMRLPAMLLMGIAAPTAGGTNILVSSLASLTGTIRHLRGGRVNMRIVLVMGIPAFIGAFIGGFLSDVAPENLLIFLAGILVFWQGIEFFILIRNRRRAGGGSAHMFGADLEGSTGMFTRNRMTMEGGVGFGVGLLGGAVGLILGSIRLPALIRILRIDPRIAAGTNLFIGFVMGSLGWIGHVVQGRIDYILLVPMGAAAMIGSYYGARFTGRVSLDTLILTMGGVLTFVGILLLVRAFVN